jgi:hypothetical protein
MTIRNSQNEFLIAQASGSQTLFTTQVPSNPDATDNTTYELGMKFRSATTGQITAIRYWKSPSESGTHTGKIWAATGGTPLATVTFANETASGWQEQALSQPLNIQANTTYVVTVNCNSHFPITYDELANSIVNGNLSSVADNNNGVAGSSGNFPTLSYRNSNYYRDIVFVAVGTPTITKVSGDNQTGTAGNALSNPFVVQVKDASGNPQSGATVDFTVTAGGGSVSAASVTTGSNGQATTVLTLGTAPPGTVVPITNTVTATVAGIGSVTFTATANPPGGIVYQKVFTNQSPSSADNSDNTTYELGMSFRASKAGQIVAIRYWKSPSETGTHVGKIWSSSGALLTNVTFINETASGWQQQALETPLSIEANTTYVVSVNVNAYYPITYDELASSIVNGDLSSVAGNNGLWGAINTFPTGSFRNSNYYRDIVYVAGSSIVKVSGDNQTGATGTPLPDPLVIQVNNSSGNPLSGVTVNFTVSAGGGSVSPTTTTTGADGKASTVLTLGPIPSGPNDAVIVTATAVGIGSITFSAKAIPANANPIYLENQKPGTTNWRINYQVKAEDEIAGFATATSVNQGDSLPIKVSLAQPGTFTVDVYRLGYYAGTGGRLMLSSGSLSGITQPAFTLIDANTRLYEAINWSTSYTIPIGNDWTSGLYVAKLTDQGSGKQAYIWFVVRDDSRNSDILFQSSFNTFLAYSYTGDVNARHSLYAFNSTDGQRAFKVSYDRPFAQTIYGSGEFNTLFRWEYNMVRWLESQGYDVNYVTNVDVHANPQLLLNHKIFLSVGHDEYWSKEGRDNVEAARDSSQKVNLGFFSANSCFWRVRFENSSTGVANRVTGCYKENWAQDPSGSTEPTNKWRSPQNNRPENSLLGVMYTAYISDLYGGFDFVVANSNHPYYAHTNLNNGDTLTQLVGFEWDAVVNNGQTPPGLVMLGQSPVTPLVIDEDVPPGTNTQISNAVHYVANSGAKVFSTGSIQWLWALDSDEVYPNRVDISAKQMVVNIFADMDALPVTPDANIILP